MVRISAFVAVQALLSTIASALPAEPLARRVSPPSVDPFYQPPAGFEQEPPGTVLRNRTIIAAFLGLVPDPVEAYQLLYRTTAVNGSAITTVTTIFKPANAKKDRFVSFQTAYDSSATICNPSYEYQLGGQQDDLISSLEQLVIQAYLILGYTVASSDYEGPEAAFGPGHLEGMGVLDGIRAVSNFGRNLGLTTSNPAVVAVGYSGGAIATGWAAALQSLYAPELNMKGYVAGGVPANLTGTALHLDGSVFSGFLPAAVDGLLKPSAYAAELKPVLDRVVTPAGAKTLEYADNNCAPNDLISFPHQSILDDSFQSKGANLFYDPIVAEVLTKNTLAFNKSETPVAPLFIYHASQDEIIPYNDTVTMVDRWCDDGVNVKFTTFGNGGHLTTEVVALGDTLDFVQKAFAGTTTAGCTRNTELESILNPIALGVELEPILIGLLNVLLNLGDNDANLKSDITTVKKSVKH